MKHNDMIIDPDGRIAKLITMPIGDRGPHAVLLYPDGRARAVDLSKCRPAAGETPQEPQP